MPRGDSILTHPAKDEIDERLLAGEGVKSVEKWLKQKYARAPKYWVTYATLQEYRKRYLNLEGEILQEVKQERRALLNQKRKEVQIQKTKDSAIYHQTKRKLAEDLFDTQTEFLNIHDKIWERIRTLEAEQVKHLNDRVICDYIGQARQTLMDYNKLVENVEKRKSSAFDVDMEEIREQQKVLQQCIIEALQETVPEAIPLFLDKLEEKLSTAELDEITSSKPKQINIQVNV